MMNRNEELMAKARGAKSAEELLAIAKENDVELTEEQANAYFEQMNKTGELSDDELDSVAGGGCGTGSNDSYVLPFFVCDKWQPQCIEGDGTFTYVEDRKTYVVEQKQCRNCADVWKENNVYHCWYQQ